MKVLVVFGIICLTLALTAKAHSIQEDLYRLDHEEERERAVKSKYEPTVTLQVAAKICKPFFVACKQNAEDKTGVRKCFVQFFNGCMKKIRTQLDEMDQCVSNAGNVFNRVQECINAPAKY